MNAFLKLLVVALMFVAAMYVVEMIMPGQQSWLKAAVAGLITGAIDIWVLDAKYETRGRQINFV